MANSDIQRAVLLASGDCRFSTFGSDFSFIGSKDTVASTYKQGILEPNQHASAGGSTLSLTAVACERLITDRNIGDNVYVDLIQKDDLHSDWYITSAHWYLLGDLTNLGFNKIQLNLLPPISMLNKTETIIWSKEYFERKGWGDWFDELSSMKDNVLKIRIS